MTSLSYKIPVSYFPSSNRRQTKTPQPIAQLPLPETAECDTSRPSNVICWRGSRTRYHQKPRMSLTSGDFTATQEYRSFRNLTLQSCSLFWTLSNYIRKKSRRQTGMLANHKDSDYEWARILVTKGSDADITLENNQIEIALPVWSPSGIFCSHVTFVTSKALQKSLYDINDYAWCAIAREWSVRLSWNRCTERLTANCTFAMNWSKTVMRPSIIFLGRSVHIFPARSAQLTKNKLMRWRLWSIFPATIGPICFFQRVWNFGEAIRPAHFEQNRMA